MPHPANTGTPNWTAEHKEDGENAQDESALAPGI
jgi:hypothetical protein